LEQLYGLLEYLYEEIECLPVYMIAKFYPFNISESQKSYYDEFRLHTENEEILKLFSSLDIKEDSSIDYLNMAFFEGVEDYDRKVKTILSKLTQNHIYFMTSMKTRQEVSIQYYDHQACNCAVCCYYRLEIPEAIEKLKKTESNELVDLIKDAYLHYELGNYLTSAKSYQKISKQADEKKKKTLTLITKFNLIKLGKLISHSYYDQNNLMYGRQLMDIDLGGIVYSSKTKSYHRKLFNYIKESKFFAESAQEMQSAVSRLREEYQNYIYGGDFSAYNYRQLIKSYAQINSFIKGNRIIYDHFNEFTGLVDEFTEGVFIALAMQKDGKHLLPYLSDYHLNQFIFSGKHKIIWQYFNKYHFKYISYNSSNRFNEIIGNLLSRNHLIKEIFDDYCPEDGFSWRNSYPEIFANCLCLAAIIDMDDKQVNSISMQLMECCHKADLPSQNCFKQMIRFFDKKSSQLSRGLLLKLLKSFLTMENNEVEDLLGIFCNELSKRNLTIKLSRSLINFLRLNETKPSNVANPHFNLIVSFYNIVEANQKESVKSCILNELRSNFDAYKFYYAVIFNVLEFEHSEFLEMFIESIYPDPNIKTFESIFFGPQGNDYPKFDMFFNVCFKFQVNPKSIVNKKLEGISDYYDWLLDFEGFDYGKFKISWIGLYPTKYYFREFAKYHVLKGVIEEYLKNNRDLRIERMYFDIYNPRT